MNAQQTSSDSFGPPSNSTRTQTQTHTNPFSRLNTNRSTSLNLPSNFGSGLQDSSNKNEPKQAAPNYGWICVLENGRVLSGDIEADATLKINTAYAENSIPFTDIAAINLPEPEARTSEVDKTETDMAETKQTDTDFNESKSGAAEADSQSELIDIVVATKDGSVLVGQCHQLAIELKTQWGSISVSPGQMRRLSSTENGTLTVGRREDGLPGWAVIPLRVVIIERKLETQMYTIPVSTESPVPFSIQKQR